MIGKLLTSRYKIISPLASGGYGETYIAEDFHIPTNPKPRYLVKRLRPDIKTDTITQRLFFQEAQVLYDLSHKHDQIPKLIAFFQENDDFYLIQDLILAHDLRHEITPGKQCQERYVIKLLHDVLTVLSFVHQNGWIHQDIKPGNIIRRQDDGKLFLIDFGGVKKVQQQTMLRTGTINSKTYMIGTKGYMPSEQLKGNPVYSSDIYALGMTAIEALTGKSANIGGKVGESGYADYEKWQKFGDEVGWRKNGIWLIDSELSFDILSKKGHLPWAFYSNRKKCDLCDVWRMKANGDLYCVKCGRPLHCGAKDDQRVILFSRLSNL
jgi:eukaryotic-like serine/threonine-protein kinase